MDLNIKLVDGYDGIEVSSIIISDGDKEFLRLGTIVGSLSVQEILNLGKNNGRQLTLVVDND